MEHLAQEIINFWLGELDAEGMASAEKRKHWFAKDRTFDQQLSARFLNFMEPACMGAFDRWMMDAKSRVALLILLEQFPRNMFREQPRAFYYDKKAQAIALDGLEKKETFELPASFAYFALMPTMHAEDLAIQELGVQSFTRLAAQHKGAAHDMLRNAQRYAEAHRDIISRFGRFPHRNSILGRVSSEEERIFLTQEGSSF